MGTPLKNYDDDELVLAIAKGDRSYSQLAEEFGLSEVHVGQIARGVRRPELQPKIKAAVQGFIDEARRLAARYAQGAVGRLGKLIATDSKACADVQRKAAVDILKFTLGDPGRPEVNVSQTANHMGGQAPAGIDADDVQAFYEFKAARDGGPTDDEPIDDGDPAEPDEAAPAEA